MDGFNVLYRPGNPRPPHGGKRITLYKMGAKHDSERVLIYYKSDMHDKSMKQSLPLTESSIEQYFLYLQQIHQFCKERTVILRGFRFISSFFVGRRRALRYLCRSH